jgi:3',5'-cyclic AMP phosphodiesterase CpdA
MCAGFFEFKIMIKLRQIFLFGAVFLGWQLAVAAEINLLSFGDWGDGNTKVQIATARQMAAYTTNANVRFDAALVLGDNFYHKMPGGVTDPRWQTEFEKMFDPVALAMPFYVALGNHDYEGKKPAAELDYAKQNPSSRWKLPAKWYRVELPAENPLVSVLVLDSNAKPLGEAAWKEQLAWLEKELARPRSGVWTIAIAHHPVISNGQHGDDKVISEAWGKLFQKYKLDFYLCGHDHDLQHLQVQDKSTTFVLAGGGGAKVRPMKRNDRGPFSRTLNGFLHLNLTPELATGKLISVNGEVAHEFTRTPAGVVKVVRTTGRDKPGKDSGEDK